jgi:hypothetical protein
MVLSDPYSHRSLERSDPKRARNTSGSRPLSALSDPDPLEQLVYAGDEEVSYGYLLKPSKVNFKSKVSNNHTSHYHQFNRPKFKDMIHPIYNTHLHANSSEFHSKHPYVQR